MLDPTEVAFHKNWQRDYKQFQRGAPVGESFKQRHPGGHHKGSAASNEIFAEAWTKGGYIVVTEPGPDVLRIKTGIVNVWVNAPDVQTGRSLSFAPEAGRATFFVEARDSQTGALLGRAIDRVTPETRAQLAHERKQPRRISVPCSEPGRSRRQSRLVIELKALCRSARESQTL
jgi:hypothetical protein